MTVQLTDIAFLIAIAAFYMNYRHLKKLQKERDTAVSDLVKTFNALTNIGFIINEPWATAPSFSSPDVLPDVSHQVLSVKQIVSVFRCDTCQRYYMPSQLVSAYGSSRQENTCIGCLKVKTQSEHPARLG